MTRALFTYSMIRLRLALLGLIVYFFSLVSATALTYKLIANEKACFFTQVDQPGAKIAFYFAVRCPRPGNKSMEYSLMLTFVWSV